MARGGRGGNRGGGRGKGSAGFAQSGGKNTTFGGGKGGGTQLSKGGANKRKVQGAGGLRPNNTYTIVSSVGDNSAVGQTGNASPGANLAALAQTGQRGKTMYTHRKPHVNPPVRGGH